MQVTAAVFLANSLSTYKNNISDLISCRVAFMVFWKTTWEA